MMQLWSTLGQIFQFLKRLSILFIPILILSIILGMIVSFLALSVLVKKLSINGLTSRYRHGLRRTTLDTAKDQNHEAKSLPN